MQEINLALRKPTMADEQALLAYKAEFLERGDELAGCYPIEQVETVQKWLEALAGFEQANQASTYLAFDSKDFLVGVINIRHRLFNDYLRDFGGHIGYSVRKSERRKGYASEILRQGLAKCWDLGLERVLITCDKDNIASAKTILKNGGILESEVFEPEDEKLMQRYWVNKKGRV